MVLGVERVGDIVRLDKAPKNSGILNNSLLDHLDLVRAHFLHFLQLYYPIV